MGPALDVHRYVRDLEEHLRPVLFEATSTTSTTSSAAAVLLVPGALTDGDLVSQGRGNHEVADMMLLNTYSDARLSAPLTDFPIADDAAACLPEVAANSMVHSNSRDGGICSDSSQFCMVWCEVGPSPV